MESEGYFSFTHNHRFRGDVGAAEAGDVGLAGVDVDLVLLLPPLANLTVLRDCLLAFLASLLYIKHQIRTFALFLI